MVFKTIEGTLSNWSFGVKQEQNFTFIDIIRHKALRFANFQSV